MNKKIFSLDLTKSGASLNVKYDVIDPFIFYQMSEKVARVNGGDYISILRFTNNIALNGGDPFSGDKRNFYLYILRNICSLESTKRFQSKTFAKHEYDAILYNIRNAFRNLFNNRVGISLYKIISAQLDDTIFVKLKRTNISESLYDVDYEFDKVIMCKAVEEYDRIVAESRPCYVYTGEIVETKIAGGINISIMAERTSRR